MNLDYLQALSLLALEDPFSLLQLKESYRREIRLWHPDLYQSEPETLKAAEERSRDINAAYDLLEPIASKKSGADWQKQIKTMLPRWENEFKTLWRNAYWTTKREGTYPGLHLSTCITTFRRAAIDPRPKWFEGCLFEDTPANRSAYQQHLLKIAPNRQFREEWARKYFALEFGSGWIFYLPASIAMLRGGGDAA